MIDGFGSKDLGDDFLMALHDAGARAQCRRRFPRGRCGASGASAAPQVVVIDARVAFVGGINIIDDMHTPTRAAAFRLRGAHRRPLLAPIHASAVNLWTLVVDPVPAARASCVDPGARGTLRPPPRRLRHSRQPAAPQ
jgi:cardiolipin synthase